MNLDTLFERELDRVIVVREAGNAIWLTIREAIVRQTVLEALAGNSRQREFVLEFMSANEVLVPFSVTDDDEVELEKAFKEFLEKEGDDGSR